MLPGSAPGATVKSFSTLLPRAARETLMPGQASPRAMLEKVAMFVGQCAGLEP